MHALLSIHDVMPDTLSKVAKILDSLPQSCRENLVLLVVPGCQWSDRQIATLKTWQEKGFILAGHGWQHKAKQINSIYHFLHATLISRNVAEHLALNEEQISTLLLKCYSWFSSNGLQAPDLYVPPAWAMGKISPDSLRNSPFRYFETTTGLMDANRGLHYKLPLVGFEADTQFRKHTLQFWNLVNKNSATDKRPLRVSIHPHDPDLLLGREMKSLLGKVTSAIHYSDVMVAA